MSGAVAVTVLVPFRNCSCDCSLAPATLPRRGTARGMTRGREKERTEIDEKVEREKLRRSVSGKRRYRATVSRGVFDRERLSVFTFGSPATKVEVEVL